MKKVPSQKTKDLVQKLKRLSHIKHIDTMRCSFCNKHLVHTLILQTGVSVAQGNIRKQLFASVCITILYKMQVGWYVRANVGDHLREATSKQTMTNTHLKRISDWSRWKHFQFSYKGTQVWSNHNKNSHWLLFLSYLDTGVRCLRRGLRTGQRPGASKGLSYRCFLVLQRY